MRPLLCKGFFQQLFQFHVVERLGDVPVGSFLNGFDGIGDAAVGRQDQHGQRGMQKMQLFHHG